jgi:retron-type reverse transcriptase
LFVEGYLDKAGWALPENQTTKTPISDELVRYNLSILENEISRLLSRDKNIVPVEWVPYIKRSIAVLPSFHH